MRPISHEASVLASWCSVSEPAAWRSSPLIIVTATPPGGQPDSATEQEPAHRLLFLRYSRPTVLVVVAHTAVHLRGSYLLYTVRVPQTTSSVHCCTSVYLRLRPRYLLYVRVPQTTSTVPAVRPCTSGYATGTLPAVHRPYSDQLSQSVHRPYSDQLSQSVGQGADAVVHRPTAAWINYSLLVCRLVSGW